MSSTFEIISSHRWLRSPTILDNNRVIAWLNRFGVDDQPRAGLLLSTVKLVSADEFVADMNDLLERHLGDGATPIALYNETERGHRGGVPHRLFAEPRRKLKRATGKAGPALVPRQRQVDEEVGSEGTLATILTQFARSHAKTIVLSPGPDTIRDRRVRRFVLVTDFIGSGDRALRYLTAAWRVRSVRSWWSRRKGRGMSFEVVAFSGTEAGVAHVRKHPCRPEVHIAQVCPTIDGVFDAPNAAIMKTLCGDYGPKAKDAQPLGYGGTGALIAFSHSMPNNAPAIFWQRYDDKEPLFPSRVTSGVASPFQAGIGDEAQHNRLIKLVGLGSAEAMVPFRIESVILAALERSPRSTEGISGRLGVALSEVEEALKILRSRGLIDRRNVPTDRGRRALVRIKGEPPSPFLSKPKEGEYFPDSLRVPRGV